MTRAALSKYLWDRARNCCSPWAAIRELVGAACPLPFHLHSSGCFSSHTVPTSKHEGMLRFPSIRATRGNLAKSQAKGAKGEARSPCHF